MWSESYSTTTSSGTKLERETERQRQTEREREKVVPLEVGASVAAIVGTMKIGQPTDI